MAEKLKPCPFCGGEAKVTENEFMDKVVECQNCGVTTAGEYTTSAAIKAWNRRAPEWTGKEQ